MAKKRSKVSLKILGVLSHNRDKFMTTEEIAKILEMDQNSVRYGLNILLKHNLVEKKPDLNDLRSYYFTIKESLSKDSFNEAVSQI